MKKFLDKFLWRARGVMRVPKPLTAVCICNTVLHWTTAPIHIQWAKLLGRPSHSYGILTPLLANCVATVTTVRWGAHCDVNVCTFFFYDFVHVHPMNFSRDEFLHGCHLRPRADGFCQIQTLNANCECTLSRRRRGFYSNQRFVAYNYWLYDFLKERTWR